MSDIALVWTGASADLMLADRDLVRDDGLETAVILSLFTDRRSEDGDTLPDGHSDRRGWWSDEFAAVTGDRHGSRLWLLSREKERQAVLDRAREYAVEALHWLLEDRVASRVDVVTEFTKPWMLGIQVTVQRPATAPAEFRFNYTWAAQERRTAAPIGAAPAIGAEEENVVITVNQALQSAAQTGDGAKIDVLGAARAYKLYVIGTGIITAGEVTLKEAHDVSYAGPWEPVFPPIAVKTGIVVKPFEGCYRGLTSPITSDIIGGGTVTVIVQGCD